MLHVGSSLRDTIGQTAPPFNGTQPVGGGCPANELLDELPSVQCVPTLHLASFMQHPDSLLEDPVEAALTDATKLSNLIGTPVGR